MPMVNYCRKCKTETPLGETCPHCGGKLSKTGERLSFGVNRLPVREWFEWNRILRIGLPALLLVFLLVVGAELLSGGLRGLEALFVQGFASAMLWLLGGLLLLSLLLLWLQGGEKVHYILDKDGVKAFTYVNEGEPLRLGARFVGSTGLPPIPEDEPALPGLVLARRTLLPWQRLRRVRIWREGSVILFFRPRFWQVLAMGCPPNQLGEAEAYIRQKLKRHKEIQVLPSLKNEK